MVGVAGFMEWGTGAFGIVSDALAATGLDPAGPFGALFPGDFFELEHAELTVFLPVTVAGADAGAAAARLPGGRVKLREIPAVEAAVVVHEGAPDDIDRTYGALGTAVAERAIGVDGPIREYYLVGFADTDDETRHRTEICWPVFLTGTPA
jgi:effector-binding domain-containing protein